MRHWIRVAISALAAVTILHWLLARSFDSRTLPWWSQVLFYLLFPGEVTSLLITGGHGGSEAEDAVAPVIGIAVNALAWAIVIVLAGRLWRRAHTRLINQPSPSSDSES